MDDKSEKIFFIDGSHPGWIISENTSLMVDSPDDPNISEISEDIRFITDREFSLMINTFQRTVNG